MTNVKLIDIIKKNIQYDSSSGTTCPRCKHAFDIYYWIYHKWELGHEIRRELGLGEKIGELIASEIEEIHDITGDKETDGKMIAAILEERVLKGFLK